jgi:hypothetical protein
MPRITSPGEGQSLLAGKPDHTSYGTSWLLKVLTGQQSLFAPVSDPTQSGHAHRKNLGLHASVRHGYVVDYVAYARCYRVFLDNNHPIIPCALLMQGSSTPWGARSISSIPPGCGVQVIVHPQRLHGYIIGVEPRRRIDARGNLADWISQASRCGVRVDGAHSQVFQCTGKGGVADWSTNRPMDSLAGEEGWITETGLRIIVDPFLAQLAVSEACGVFAFYHDDLLRLAGYNTHWFSCGGELEVLDDEGEVRWVAGAATYPWEQLGCLAPGVDPFRDVDPQAAQLTTPYYSYVEPADDRQLPFHRSVAFRGYLGQAGKRLTLLPPDADRYLPAGPGPQAVFEEFRSLTGRYALRSAKGIHLAKRPAIPAPHPRRRPEEKYGDNEANYRASGVLGNGPMHQVTGGPRAADRFPHLQQVAGMADLHAWVFNWEACHPFHYHAQDWDLPEESKTRLGAAAAPIPFGLLAREFYLPRPDALLLQVDHRYGSVPYYPNEANLDINDDGTIVLADGYGAEIRLAGGHIFFQCPGDIWLQPGRNVNAWAGRDLCLRARNSLDASATEGDVRLKAERNLHALAGNGEKVGAVLLESKAPSSFGYAGKVGEDVVSGGIQLKAGKGGLTAWARDIYLRVGGGDVDSGGEFVIDADQGNAPIVTNSRFLLNYVREATATYFGSEGDVKVANVYTADGSIFGKGVEVLGPGIFNGTVLVNGWFEAVGGHIATELAQNPEYRFVLPLKDRPLAEAKDAIEAAIDREAGQVDAGEQQYKKGFTDYWYSRDRPGHAETIRAAHFTFRSDEQYRTGDFELYEARWQQLTRLVGEQLGTWEERPATVANRATYPYPGEQAWKKGRHLHQQDLGLHDVRTGRARDRTAAQADYEQPEYQGENQPETLDSNYVVIP